MTSKHQSHYVPALRFRWLTKAYDPFISFFLREAHLRQKLLQQLSIKPASRILDVGCGTGTFLVMLKQTHPSADVVGLDGDAEVLSIAKKKIEHADVQVTLQLGLAEEPPFAPGSFDTVVSTLVFHHLQREEKIAALSAIHSLLRAQGELHIADFGLAQNALIKVLSLGPRLLDGWSNTKDNFEGRLPSMMQTAGFNNVEETYSQNTVFGTIRFYKGVK